MGACRNSIVCVFVLFLAGFLFKSSFFSKSKLCTWPLFSHFVTNLDWLAGQLILYIPPWGHSCGRRLYGSSILQSQLCLKNIKSFLYKKKLVNNCIIPSTHAERKKLPFVLINTLLLHIPLLALTDGQTEWLTEERIHLLHEGWRNFFSRWTVVLVFWFLAGNKFWCYLLTYLEYNTVVALC